MVLLMVASLVGGAITVVALWPFGALIALASAPFGGSLLTLLAGLLLAFLRTRAERNYERRAQASIQEPKTAA